MAFSANKKTDDKSGSAVAEQHRSLKLLFIYSNTVEGWMLCNTYKLRGKVLMLIRGNYEFLKRLILQFFSSINIWHYFSFSGSARALEVFIVIIHLLWVTVYRAKREASMQRWDCDLRRNGPLHPTHPYRLFVQAVRLLILMS